MGGRYPYQQYVMYPPGWVVNATEEYCNSTVSRGLYISLSKNRIILYAIPDILSLDGRIFYHYSANSLDIRMCYIYISNKNNLRHHLSDFLGVISVISIKLLINHDHKINKGRFLNNSQIDTLISKRLSIEDKAKLSQLTSADFVTIAKLAR